jgi:hypothetical protein
MMLMMNVPYSIDTWTRVRIPIAALGITSNRPVVDRVIFSQYSGGNIAPKQVTMFLDSIAFTASTTETTRLDGGWTAWSSCPSCNGNQTRTCTAPTPATNGGIPCDGDRIRQCVSMSCDIPLPGGWSKWGSCSATCNGGIQIRTCSNPGASLNGASCVGEATRACATQSCDQGSFMHSLELFIGMRRLTHKC